MLPANNFIVEIMYVLFCINLVFSYPLIAWPANQTAAYYILGTHEDDKLGHAHETLKHYWKTNIIRSGLLLLSILTTIYVASFLDHLISITGILLGMSTVLFLPALCHYKLVAETRLDKAIDSFIICLAVVLFFFGPVIIMSKW